MTRLNREVRLLLDAGFGPLWIEGELSNVARPASGHLYFTLKDPGAQVRCAMFRQRNRGLGFRPVEGAQVLVRARAGLYEPRGDYQLIVEHMEPAGEGALRAAFDALKARLGAEGLFDPAIKRPLPPLPKRIGVITSPTGAAVRDVIDVLRRRFPSVPVLVYPVTVQGESAAADIAATLQLAGRRADCDVLILARGGGSLEDLVGFNDERVARAIRACPVPVIAGVGHETDVTIADFAADLRAPTPSAAAEQAVPDAAAVRARYGSLADRLARTVSRRLREIGERVASTKRRLIRQHPGTQLRMRAQRLDELDARLRAAARRALTSRRERLAAAHARLGAASPRVALGQLDARLAGLSLRLESATRRRLDTLGSRVALASRALATVSPLATLSRGYAIVTTTTPAGERRVVDDVGMLKPGQSIETRVARGTFDAVVDEIHAAEEPDIDDDEV